jgi:hypothetical protein
MPRAPKGLVFNLLSLQKKELRLLYFIIFYTGYHGVGRENLSIIQDTFMAISGWVMDGQGKRPIPQADLKVFKGKDWRAVALTDNQGYYNVSRLNLPPGLYELRTNFSGYQEFRAQARVNENKTTFLNFEMKKE